MGYRSDVKYVICLPDHTTYTKFMGEVQLKLGDNPECADILEAFQLTVNKPETGFTPAFEYEIRVHWEDVKWYDSFGWVRVQTDLFRTAEEYDGAWYFARLGEDDDDYETDFHDPKSRYGVYDFIELHRSTAFV